MRLSLSILIASLCFLAISASATAGVGICLTPRGPVLCATNDKKPKAPARRPMVGMKCYVEGEIAYYEENGKPILLICVCPKVAMNRECRWWKW